MAEELAAGIVFELIVQVVQFGRPVLAGVHDGKGDMPVLAAIVVSAAVAAIGFTLVRRSLRHDHLIKV